MLHSVVFEKINGMSSRKEMLMQKSYVKRKETKRDDVIDLFLIRVYYSFTVKAVNATFGFFGENKWHDK